MSDSGNGSGSGGSGLGSGLPTSLAAAVALLVAALAAIGLTGDALLRAVRNDPVPLSIWLIVALAGGGIFAFAQGDRVRVGIDQSSAAPLKLPAVEPIPASVRIVGSCGPSHLLSS